MAKYFCDTELQCKCCGELKIDPQFLDRLDKLRETWGKPIYVSCAYRCEKHNVEVGGCKGSTHTLGVAADIYVDGSKNEYEEFFQFVLNSKLFDGVGHYPKQLFVHVDLRVNGTDPNGYRWEG